MASYVASCQWQGRGETFRDPRPSATSISLLVPHLHSKTRVNDAHPTGERSRRLRKVAEVAERSRRGRGGALADFLGAILACPG